MSDKKSADALLEEFTGTVESLLNRYRTLKEKTESIHEKNKTLEEQVEELRSENQKLKEKLDQQRLEFSELAGELEVTFGQIKNEADKLLSERPE